MATRLIDAYHVFLWQMKPNDPQQICCHCYRQVTSWASFRIMVRQKEEQFRKNAELRTVVTPVALTGKIEVSDSGIKEEEEETSDDDDSGIKEEETADDGESQSDSDSNETCADVAKQETNDAEDQVSDDDEYSQSESDDDDTMVKADDDEEDSIDSSSSDMEVDIKDDDDQEEDEEDNKDKIEAKVDFETDTEYGSQDQSSDDTDEDVGDERTIDPQSQVESTEESPNSQSATVTDTLEQSLTVSQDFFSEDDELIEPPTVEPQDPGLNTSNESIEVDVEGLNFTLVTPTTATTYAPNRIAIEGTAENWDCPVCDEYFTDYTQLRDHLKDWHLSEMVCTIRIIVMIEHLLILYLESSSRTPNARSVTRDSRACLRHTLTSFRTTCRSGIMGT